MRIDLPGCGLEYCKYQFNGNCTDTKRYETCDYRHVSERLYEYESLVEKGILRKLPCPEGSSVYIITVVSGVFNITKNYFVKEVKFSLDMIDDIGKTVFLTVSEARDFKEKLEKGEVKYE